MSLPARTWLVSLLVALPVVLTATFPGALATEPGSLIMSPTWKTSAGQAGSSFGSSVASAGDVNGDGFGDLIAGAPNYHDPGSSATQEGRAFVYHGSSAGPYTQAAWSAGGVRRGFGQIVAPAGDVNGDGFDDVLVDEPQARVSTVTGQIVGQVSVFMGSAAGLESDPSLVLFRETEREFGAAVAPAGDVNGDGLDDVIIGSPNPAGPSFAYVYLGTTQGLSSSPAWTTSLGGSSRYGAAVAGLEDKP